MAEQQEYYNSMGIQSILDQFVKWLSNSQAPTWDTTIINLSTLVRNNIDSDKSDSDILEATSKDIGSLITGIQIYLTHIQDKPDFPYVVLFIPKYDAIPQILLRKPSPSTLRINKLTTQFEKEISDRIHGDIQEVLGMPCYFVIAGNNYTYPHVWLRSFIDKINTSTKEISKVLSRQYMLISHCALDLHMNMYYKSFRLLESYTSRIRDRITFGEKVFDIPHVPFNKYTHVLFGDKTHIRPAAQRNTRKMYAELAYKNRWKSRTPEDILQDIQNVDLPLGTMLHRVKF